MYDEVIHLKKSPIPTDLSNYYTIPETDALLDEKLDISALSSNITLYATTAASDIPWYNKLVTSIEDVDYDEPAVNVPIWPITWADQIVWELWASAWLFVGNPWIINITTIWEIRRTSWGSGRAEFYFKVFHRDSLGTETEIAVSNPTGVIESTIYEQFYTVALLNNGAFDSTDRITIKFYASKIWWWPDPEYEFSFGGDNPVRTLLPIPAELVLTNYYTKDETDWLLDTKLWETFETVSKNLKGNPYTLNYTMWVLTSIVYTVWAGSITKTFNNTGDKITSIVLSWDTPDWIELTKTLIYTGDTLTSITYS